MKYKILKRVRVDRNANRSASMASKIPLDARSSSSLTHLQQRLYILTGSDEVPLSWRAFIGLSVKIMYAGPQKAAFPMAEGRKGGEKERLGREAGRSAVNGHESQTWICIFAAG